MEPFVTSRREVRIPRIIYGTAWKKADTARLVELAIQSGFRGIDTACQPKHYDEAGVGDGVAACVQSGLARTDLYLQTKFTPVDGQDAQRIPYDPQSALPDQVAQSVAISLRNLRTEYLDCLVLHSPMPTAEQTRTVWRAFESLAAAGKIRQLGISNCYEIQTLERLYREARIKPAVLQNRFYADTRYDQELRAFCTRENIVYQSFWTLSANPHLLAHPAVAAMALRHRRSAPQILYRYLTQVAVVPLTGTTSRAHMLQDVAIFEFRLTDAECSAITAMLAT